MITLELGELYGMDNVEELMQAIKELQDIGMSDSEIQAILERSKNKAESEKQGMTREEAITLIKSALKTMYLPKSKEYISDLGYALEIAIKALEQEPILDKIRAEIEHVKDNPLFGMVSNDTMLEVVLEIIDKYKAGSEDLGDYPDTIHNQFDNMTGSMNL